MGQQEPIGRRELRSREIPDKLYFRIGEVAELCELPAYVLRFWESEFPQLKPNKGGTGQRLYRRRDVEMALRIKTLLYDQGYTIPGARLVFQGEQKRKAPQLKLAIEEPGESGRRKAIEKLRKELVELLALVSIGAAGSETSQAHPIRLARRPRVLTGKPEAAGRRLFDEPLMFPEGGGE